MMKFTGNCFAIIGLLVGALVLFVCIISWFGYFNQENVLISPSLPDLVPLTLFGIVSIPASLTILFRYTRSYLFFLAIWAALAGLAMRPAWMWVPVLLLIPHAAAIVLRDATRDMRDPEALRSMGAACALSGMVIPPILMFVRFGPALRTVIAASAALDSSGAQQLLAAAVVSLTMAATGLSLWFRGRASYVWFAVQVTAALAACASAIADTFWFMFLALLPHAAALVFEVFETRLARGPMR